MVDQDLRGRSLPQDLGEPFRAGWRREVQAENQVRLAEGRFGGSGEFAVDQAIRPVFFVQHEREGFRYRIREKGDGLFPQRPQPAGHTETASHGIPVGMGVGDGDDVLRTAEKTLQFFCFSGVDPIHSFLNPSANLQIILHLINHFYNFVGVLNIIKHKHNEQSS